LLLLAALAFAAVVLIGAAADAAGLERRFRANTQRARALSVFTLGNLIVRSLELARIRLGSVWKHLKQLRRINAALFPKFKLPRSENRNVSLPLAHHLFCVDCGWNGALYGWPP
jgi:hypothetical protein